MFSPLKLRSAGACELFRLSAIDIWPRCGQQHIITPAIEQMEFHLKRGEQLLGVLISKTTDFPWLVCEFNPTASFDEVQPLFDEELKLLEAESMDVWQSAYERINALGLRLIDTENEKDIGEFLLHIRGNEAWFRC